MPIQVIRSGARSGFRPRRRLRARRGSGTQDLIADLLFQGADSLDRNRDRDFQLELLGEQLSASSESQQSSQKSSLDQLLAALGQQNVESERRFTDLRADRSQTKEENVRRDELLRDQFGLSREQTTALIKRGQTQDELANKQFGLTERGFDLAAEEARFNKRRARTTDERNIILNEKDAAIRAFQLDRGERTERAQQIKTSFSELLAGGLEEPTTFSSLGPGTFTAADLGDIIQRLSGNIRGATGANPLATEARSENLQGLRKELGRRSGTLRLGSLGDLEKTIGEFMTPERIAEITSRANKFNLGGPRELESINQSFDEILRKNARSLFDPVPNEPPVNETIETPIRETPITPTPPDQQTIEQVLLPSPTQFGEGALPSEARIIPGANFGPSTPGDQVGAAPPFIQDIARKIARRNLLQQGLIA